VFPTDINIDKIVEQVERRQPEQSSRIGRSFLFDFNTGQHKIVDGAVTECDELTAIKQWLKLMVRTTLSKYKVYQGAAFGHSAESFIGRRTLPKGFVASELEREIAESCNLCPAIERVGNFEITRTTRGMVIAFTAYLVNGELLGVRYDG